MAEQKNGVDHKSRADFESALACRVAASSNNS